MGSIKKIFLNILKIIFLLASLIVSLCSVTNFRIQDNNIEGDTPPFGTQYLGFFRRNAVRKGLVRSTQKFCYGYFYRNCQTRSKKISSATNENYFFSLILLKYIHLTIIKKLCYCICPRINVYFCFVTNAERG